MNSKLFFNASKQTITFSKELRQRMTDAEDLLWRNLRNRKLDGFKFRRQHAINNYIVDFYCAEKMLSIELDGEIHLEKEQQILDKERTLQLEVLGIKEIRFKNEEVLTDIKSVLNKIKTILTLI